MRFRPAPIPEGDPHPGGATEWADNALSNTLAWASETFTPAWCKDEQHWTARLAQYLFTDCPCCLLFRGIVVGVALMLLLNLFGAVVGITLALVLA